VPALEKQTGRPFNTINKWATGISYNYAIGILAEATSQPS
jgi:hypothetical protein